MGIGGRLRSDFIIGFTSGVASGLVAAVLVTLASGGIADAVAYGKPDCANLIGVRPTTNVQADGRHEPTGPNRTDRMTWQPAKAVDGDPNTIWIPPLDAARSSVHGMPTFAADGRTLTLTFDGARDVRLVCVVNGLASTPFTYRNWGRVRTVTAWADDGATQTTLLRTMDDAAEQVPQQVRIERGTARRIQIRVDDAYPGQRMESYDPDVCLTPGGPHHGRCRCGSADPRHAGTLRAGLHRRWHPPGRAGRGSRLRACPGDEPLAGVLGWHQGLTRGWGRYLQSVTAERNLRISPLHRYHRASECRLDANPARMRTDRNECHQAPA